MAYWYNISWMLYNLISVMYNLHNILYTIFNMVNYMLCMVCYMLYVNIYVLHIFIHIRTCPYIFFLFWKNEPGAVGTPRWMPPVLKCSFPLKSPHAKVCTQYIISVRFLKLSFSLLRSPHAKCCNQAWMVLLVKVVIVLRSPSYIIFVTMHD